MPAQEIELRLSRVIVTLHQRRVVPAVRSRDIAARGALGRADRGGDRGDAIALRGDTALVAENFVALRYVARRVGERRGRSGDLRHADLDWAALHTVLINLGTVIMEPGVSRQLRKPFLTKRQVERWKVATTKLFVEGEIRRLNG